MLSGGLVWNVHSVSDDLLDSVNSKVIKELQEWSDYAIQTNKLVGGRSTSTCQLIIGRVRHVLMCE